MNFVGHLQADTCIIYDSDWNPQNDLQAMARCHRFVPHSVPLSNIIHLDFDSTMSLNLKFVIFPGSGRRRMSKYIA